MARVTAWLDTGTFESLLEARKFISVIEKRQGLKIGCIEEIAFLNGFINKDKLIKSSERYAKSGYGKYLMNIINE